MGVLVRNLSPDDASTAIRNNALKSSFTKASILTLNSVIIESPEALGEFGEEVPQVIAKGINHKTVCSPPTNLPIIILTNPSLTSRTTPSSRPVNS